MSIPKHIREHRVLGLHLADKVFSGVQKTTTSYYHLPACYGETSGTDEATLTNGLLLVPFIVPPNETGVVNEIAVVTNNNGAATADRARIAIWDANGNLLDETAHTVTGITSNGKKSFSYGFTPVSITTSTFIVGIAFYLNATNAYEAINLTSGSVRAVSGLRGTLSEASVGTVAAPLYAVPNANASVPLPDPYDDSNIAVLAAYDLCPAVGINYAT